jgi:hypothetical protein
LVEEEAPSCRGRKSRVGDEWHGPRSTGSIVRRPLDGISGPAYASEWEKDMVGTIESSVEKSIERMEAQLKMWDAKLAELMAKGQVASREARSNSRKRMDQVKSKLEAARARLAEVKKASSTGWESLQAGLEKAWNQAEASSSRWESLQAGLEKAWKQAEVAVERLLD